MLLFPVVSAKQPDVCTDEKRNAPNKQKRAICAQKKLVISENTGGQCKKHMQKIKNKKYEINDDIWSRGSSSAANKQQHITAPSSLSQKILQKSGIPQDCHSSIWQDSASRCHREIYNRKIISVNVAAIRRTLNVVFTICVAK